MGERAKVILNEYSAKNLLMRDTLDLDKFYTADLKLFVEVARKEIERLNNIINELKKENSRLRKKIKELKEENKQFKDNWDKLKEWLESNWEESQDIWFVKIINKMQELEGSDKE